MKNQSYNPTLDGKLQAYSNSPAHFIQSIWGMNKKYQTLLVLHYNSKRVLQKGTLNDISMHKKAKEHQHLMGNVKEKRAK